MLLQLLLFLHLQVAELVVELVVLFQGIFDVGIPWWWLRRLPSLRREQPIALHRRLQHQ